MSRAERLIVLWSILCLVIMILVASVVAAEILRLVEQALP